MANRHKRRWPTARQTDHPILGDLERLTTTVDPLFAVGLIEWERRLSAAEAENRALRGALGAATILLREDGHSLTAELCERCLDATAAGDDRQLPLRVVGGES